MGGGAPYQKKPVHKISFKPDVMDDDDDLHLPWSLPPAPDLLLMPFPLHPSTEAVLRQQRAPRGHTLHVYTDGSAGVGTTEENYENTWAVAIFISDEPDAPWTERTLIDWYCGHCERDPLSASWLGTTETDSRSAEAEALMWSLLWFVQSRQPGPLFIYSDALSVLQAANGQWGFDSNVPVLLRLRCMYQFVQTMLGQQDLHLTHVRGHTGDPGNELVDTIANMVRSGQLPVRHPTLNLAKWFHGTIPAIAWAWCELDSDRRPDDTIHHSDGAFNWFAPDPPSEDLTWIRNLPTIDATELEQVSLDLCIGTYNVGSIKEAGRAAYLREQAHHYGYHLIGLQETRSTITDPGDSNYIRLVSPSDHGVGGVELWLARHLSFATSKQQKVHWKRDHVQVLHADSQTMLVAITLPFLDLLCCVAHAPHSGSTSQHLQTWWNKLDNLLQRHLKKRHLVMMIDANADPLPTEGQVGQRQPILRDRLRLGDQLWTKVVQRYSLMLPSTFDTMHPGSDATWTSNDGLKWARDDYVAIPTSWCGFHLTSMVDHNLDSGTQGLDHSAVCLRVRGILQGKTSSKHSPAFDRAAIRQASQDTWQHFFAQWPSMPWNMEVTTHAAALEKEFQHRLQTFFPLPERKRNRPRTFSDNTWDLFKERNTLKKVLAGHHRALHGLQLHSAWVHMVGSEHPVGPTTRWLAYALRISATWCRLKLCNASLKKSIHTDRATQVQDIVRDIGQSDHRNVLRLLKPFRLGRRVATLGRKALPIVYLESGEVANSKQEATERWKRHFGEMEGGTPTTFEDLLSRQPSSRQYPDVDIADLPTLCEVEQALRATKCGKGMGHDQIPGDVLHVAASEVAYLVWPLFMKQSVTRCESLQFKGGRLVTAYKRRGDPGLCANHRALLVSNSLGKSFHSIYRKRVLPYLNSSASQLQFTAQAKPSIAIAAHMVRLYQSWCHRHKRSSFYLFVDIREAFYRVLRQHAIDATFQDDHVLLFLRRMGINDMHLEDVAKLMEGTNALEDTGCPNHLRGMISEFHRDTFFVLDGDGQPIRTERGTRPGDGFADILWSLVFTRWLKDLESILHCEGIFRTHHWNGCVGLGTSDGERQVEQAIIAWADDVVIMADTSDPTKITPMVKKTTEIVVDKLLRHGMTPNLSTGKTEVVLDVRGPASVKVRRQIFNQDHGRIDFDSTLPDQPGLQAVYKYRHLGGYVVHGAKLRPEINHRLAQGHQILQDYKTKIFQNKEIPLSHRVTIVRSTALMATLYNCGTWGHLTQHDSKVWHHGVVKLYRRALQKLYPWRDLQHFSDIKVLCIVDALPPAIELRMARRRTHIRAGSPARMSVLLVAFTNGNHLGGDATRGLPMAIFSDTRIHQTSPTL